MKKFNLSSCFKLLFFILLIVAFNKDVQAAAESYDEPPVAATRPVSTAGEEEYSKGRENEYQKDYENAFQNYKLSEGKGYVPAKYSIGMMYKRGLRVSEVGNSSIEAYNYFLDAASQGNTNAKFQMGIKYWMDGEVNPKGFSREIPPYLLQAGEEGHLEAQLKIGHIFKERAKNAETERTFNNNKWWSYEWFMKAADQGNEKAENELEKLLKESFKK